ncbi:MAG: hypothetical protein K2U26_18365, partial [Cyclobacteriaceae bacterium]|nr:hypothetical protein [Cyclobacteriaceae bacterium]
QVTMMGYEEDSLRSGPELTEIRRDTMKIPVTYKVDSVTTAVRDSLVIKSTYHNDRTLLQAKAIGDFLTQQGIPPSKISCSGKAIAEEIPENRKTRVSVVIH